MNKRQRKKAARLNGTWLPDLVTVTSFTNAPCAFEPLTAEGLAATVKMIMDKYMTEPLVVRPDLYDFVTPCCGRRYAAMAPMSECAYGCGAFRVDVYRDPSEVRRDFGE